jgi:hypothetical protein
MFRDGAYHHSLTEEKKKNHNISIAMSTLFFEYLKHRRYYNK